MRLVFRSGIFFSKLKQAFILVIFILHIPAYSFGGSKDDILLIVHDREIAKDEFLYHFHKNNQALNQQNIDEYLELFINFQLKLAQAREERMHHNIGFINELTEYRLLLAAPYLTNKEKEQEFVLEASERLNFELNASHIFVKIDPDVPPEDTITAYSKAILIRNRIVDGEPFEQLALAISDDPMATENSGNLGYFTAFQSDYSFESAVYDMLPGEISMPVRTNDGYHIIQLYDKRKTLGQMKTDQEINTLIFEAKDERKQMIEDAFVEKLKEDWNFTEMLDALDIIYELADERVYKGNWITPASRSFNETLFLIDGKRVYQKDFISYMGDFETLSRHLSIRGYIFSLYQKFVSVRLIQYENYKLGETYPEFRFQLQEYRDAMLLLAITRQKVWLKAESDREGLEKTYSENKEKYMREERVIATIFSTSNERMAKRGVKMYSRNLSAENKDVKTVLNQITVKQGAFSRGDHPIIDRIHWKEGVSGIINLENKYYFVFIHNIVKPEYKTMDEAYEMVLADYQDYLMQNWIKELRSTYIVQIKEEVLSSLTIN